MGITGLLPQLKPIQNPVTLHRYEGCTLAIDGYAWLHRAAHGCCEELCLNEPTPKYLSFLIKKLDLLQRKYNITPYLVFDGDRLDAKSGTELKRRAMRLKNREIGIEFYKQGQKSKSWEYFQKSVDVTPQMAKCWIEYCKTHKVKYIVAPFEADAQMVYLENQKIVDGIISEDSDLLVFGCNRLITKLKDNGDCIEICSKEFCNLPRKFPLYDLTHYEFQNLVCLSGCDYTDGINRIGLLKAMEYVKTYKRMDRIILAMQRDGKYEVPASFIKEYQRALICFQYQRVFCPQSGKLTTLNELPADPLEVNENFFDYIGYSISKVSGEKEYLTDLSQIDHDSHYLISIGDRTPGNHNAELINREVAITQSLHGTLLREDNSETKIVKRSLTIDSFFVQNKKSGESPSSSPEGKGPSSQNCISNRSAIRNKLMNGNFHSSSIKNQVHNSIIDKRKLISRSVNLGSSKFFNAARTSTSTSSMSVSSDKPRTSTGVVCSTSVIIPSFDSDDEKEEEEEEEEEINLENNSSEQYHESPTQRDPDNVETNAETDTDDISFDTSKDPLDADKDLQDEIVTSRAPLLLNISKFEYSSTSSVVSSLSIQSNAGQSRINNNNNHNHNSNKKEEQKRILRPKNPNIVTRSPFLSKNDKTDVKLSNRPSMRDTNNKEILSRSNSFLFSGASRTSSSSSSSQSTTTTKVPSLSRFIYRDSSSSSSTGSSTGSSRANK